MYAFIPRSLCALRRVAARHEHARFGATQGIRLAVWGPHLTAEATDGRRALMVQTLLPPADKVPWPAFKEFPDDAAHTIVDPKDLERAAKLGGELLKIRGDLGLGVATVGNNVCLGLGSDVISTRCLDGRFPDIKSVIPKGAPLFTFRVDPKLLADTLLAIADMLPETDRGVQVFFYGTNLPIGLCARNPDNGLLIDGLFVPLVSETKEDTDEPAGAAGAGTDEDADDEPDPDAEPQEEEEGDADDAEPDAETEEAAEAEPAPEPEPVKPKRQRRSRKAKASSA